MSSIKDQIKSWVATEAQYMVYPTRFKSIKVHIQHARGADFVQIEGTVQKIENGRVYLKGLFYDFSLSLKDFQTRNVLTH